MSSFINHIVACGCEDAPACGCDRTGEAPVSRAQYIAYKNAMGVRRFVAGRVVSMAEGRALELSALADSKARGQREVHIVAAARDRIEFVRSGVELLHAHIAQCLDVKEMRGGFAL